MRFVSSVALFLPLIGSSMAYQFLKMSHRSGQTAAKISLSSSDNYLSSISSSGSGWVPATAPPELQEENDSIKIAMDLPKLATELPKPTMVLRSPPATDTEAGHDSGLVRRQDDGLIAFSHATMSYFDIDKLKPKGPRKNADVGRPHDSTRPLVTVGPTSVGSWWCADGGWPSPALRATTEVFFVFSGHGCVTDLDGTRHHFGPGDTVILPKGWSGRWDIAQSVHKVWVVHDHPGDEGRYGPIRAIITPYSSYAPQNLSPLREHPNAIHGTPKTAARTIYNIAHEKVGCWTCTPGSFPVVNLHATECFHVLEGVFVLTNVDGSARRCVAGDTVVLPRGWSGYYDIIETVKKLWVIAE